MGRRLLALALAVALGAVAVQATLPRTSPPTPLALNAWAPHSTLRGMGLPPKSLSDEDFAALDALQPGSVVVFSAQLGDADPIRWIGPDPRLQRWLQAHQDVLQIVRMWPVRGPEDPWRLAVRIVALHHQYPWIQWFEIGNEPDIEWPASSRTSWSDIGAWTEAVWWDVQWLRTHVAGASDVRLLFPPLAQGSPMDPERIGYDALRSSVQLYLDGGDGIAGHEYWDRGSVYLVEERWPTWLVGRLSSVQFFVTEAGRRPLASNGLPDDALGREMVEFARRTRAKVVAPFVLSSPGGSFNQFDFVDRFGVPRPQLFVWTQLGP